MVSKPTDTTTMAGNTPAAGESRSYSPGGKSLHRLFIIGIALKCIDGAMEAICGSALFFVSKSQISHLILWMLGNELYEYPKDFFTKVALKADKHLWYSSKNFAAFFLLGHGLVKLFLVVNLLRNRLWAYPVAMTVLLAFVGYQIFRLPGHFSITLSVLTASDVAIILVIFLEYRGKRRSAG
jgi:uncharacterized membrane protein